MGANQMPEGQLYVESYCNRKPKSSEFWL